MSDKTLLLLKKLEKDFREKHRLRMIRASSHCLSVISSSLFTKCEEIECVLHACKPVDELEKLLTKYAIPRPSCGLPPYNPKLTLIKLKQIYPQISSKAVYTVQLPENHPSYDHRRAGLILRQHLIRGQIKALFVAGTEQNSPAHRALNLRCGDQLLAISGFPLNWRTLELLRFGLLEAEEIKGLQYNANLNDLARYLLDEPYRRDRTCSDPTKGMAKPLLTLVGTKASVRLNPSRGSDESINKSWKTSQSKEQGNTHEILYRETVLNVANQDSGLGLQLGFDEAANGVFIVSILPHSEAALDGTLSEGDQIVEINYENIESMDPREALKRIKTVCQKTSSLHVKVARPLHDLDDDPEQSTNDTSTEVNGIGQKSHFGPNNAADGDIAKEAASDLEERGKRNSTVKNQIDLEAKYSYHLDYWRAQFSPDVEVLIAEYDISHSTCGLGISLEGTMEQDEEESEPLPHHYIVDLTPQGPIESQGILRPGDELLEINENVLFGEDHLRVARILHNIHPKGFMICARYGKPKEIISDGDEQRQTDDMSEKSRNVEPPFDLDDIQFARPAISEEAMTNSSEGSSDVDRNPTPIRVIFARSIRRSSNLKEKQNEKMVGARLPTDQNLSSENDGTCQNPISNCDADACHLYDTTEGRQYSRLPMPARLASLTDEIPDQRDRIRHHSMVNSQSRAEEKQSLSHSIRTTLHPDKKCLSLMLTKRTGEFLGLEIDAEDGGPLGITLLGIIPDSPLDRLRVAGHKSKPWGSRNSLRRFSAPFERKSDLPMLKPGDWIASVAGYTFRNRSNFKARRLLRRLVVSSGVFEIEYIPYEWLTDTPADNSSVSWDAEIDAIGRGYNTESDPSES